METRPTQSPCLTGCPVRTICGAKQARYDNYRQTFYGTPGNPGVLELAAQLGAETAQLGSAIRAELAGHLEYAQTALARMVESAERDCPPEIDFDALKATCPSGPVEISGEGYTVTTHCGSAALGEMRQDYALNTVRPAPYVSDAPLGPELPPANLQ